MIKLKEVLNMDVLNVNDKIKKMENRKLISELYDLQNHYRMNKMQILTSQREMLLNQMDIRLAELEKYLAKEWRDIELEKAENQRLYNCTRGTPVP